MRTISATRGCFLGKKTGPWRRALRKRLGACMACALALLSPVAASAADAVPQAQSDALRIHDAIDSAGTKIDSHDPAGARDLLLATMASAGYANATPYDRYFAQRLMAWSYLDLNDHPAALVWARKATQSPSADEIDWQMRVRAAAWTDDFDDASASLIVLSQRWPGKVSGLADQTIGHVTANVSTAVSQDRAYALFGTLIDAGWVPNDAFLDVDELLLALTRHCLERGDIARAKAYGARIRAPDILIAMRADKRFDEVVAAAPDRFDVVKALDGDLARYRALQAAQPEKLEGVVTLAAHLNSMGRESEALALIDAALARIAAGKPFADQAEKLNWAYDARSTALIGLGRGNEATSTMARGAVVDENGEPNVSQAINLADIYNGMGRPDDALASVARIDLNYPSPYGRMSLQGARACAYAQRHEKEKLMPLLAYLKSHAGDGERVALEAFVCADDLDGAAAMVTAQLDDPAQRGAILLKLQDYPARPSAFSPDFHRRWLEIRARPDVQAAIARVGRIQFYPMTSLGY